MSVKNLTYLGSIVITVALLGMLIETCSEGGTGVLECSENSIPMISAVICIHPYDRVFCILTIWFTLGVMQVNIRAMYKILYEKIDTKINNLLYYLGFAGMFFLNCVGFFDEH